MRNRAAPQSPLIKEMGQSGTNRKGCKNNRPLMLHKRGSRKVCPNFFRDTPITYSLWFLRFPVPWVKTERLQYQKLYSVACHITARPRLDISYVDGISRQNHFWPWAPSVFWLQNCQWLRGPPIFSSVWGIPSTNTLPLCRGCIKCNLPTSAPVVHTGCSGPVWVPMGLLGPNWPQKTDLPIGSLWIDSKLFLFMAE